MVTVSNRPLMSSYRSKATLPLAHAVLTASVTSLTVSSVDFTSDAHLIVPKEPLCLHSVGDPLPYNHLNDLTEST